MSETSGLKKSTEPSVLCPSLWQENFSISGVEPYFFSCSMVVLSYGETQSLVVEQQHGVDKGWDTAHQQLCGDPTGKGPNLPSLSHICFRP